MLANIPRTQKIFVMVGIMLSLFLAALDQTIVATAMPRIVSDLAGLEDLSWVFTAYMLTSTVIVPIYGKLSDIYGRKYFVISAIVLFMIGSALSGISQNMTQLIIFRALQGLGGGAIFANVFATIGDLFPPVERGKWQGMFGGVFGLASVIGPMLGGWLTDHASWRWTFYINIPVGILALIVIGFLMPKITPSIKNKYIDFTGAILLTIALVTLLLGFVWGGSQYPWASWQIISLFITAVVDTGIFILVERKVQEPILPLDLFKNSIFTVSMIVIFLMGIGMFGAILYVPLFAQLVLGISATNSGTILTPLTLGLVVASIVTGQIISRTGRYKFAAVGGLAIVGIGLYLLSLMTVDTTQVTLVAFMILTGLGLGMTLPTYTLVVQNAFDHSRLGVATASTQLFRSIGATVGTAILGGILNSNLSSKFGDLAQDKFVQLVEKNKTSLFTGTNNYQFDISKIDANKLQGLLTGEGRKAIETQLSHLPPQVQSQALTSFNDFLLKTKEAFAFSITEVFFIASLLMGAATIASLFLQEIKLRKSHAPAFEEAGKELAVEEGTIPSRNEPAL